MNISSTSFGECRGSCLFDTLRRIQEKQVLGFGPLDSAASASARVQQIFSQGLPVLYVTSPAHILSKYIVLSCHNLGHICRERLSQTGNSVMALELSLPPPWTSPQASCSHFIVEGDVASRNYPKGQ